MRNKTILTIAAVAALGTATMATNAPGFPARRRARRWWRRDGFNGVDEERRHGRRATQHRSKFRANAQ